MRNEESEFQYIHRLGLRGEQATAAVDIVRERETGLVERERESIAAELDAHDLDALAAMIRARKRTGEG